MAEDRITAALRGPVSQADGFAAPQLPPQGTQPQQNPDEQGDGTAQSGYVTPDLGPFECENCTHFQPPGTCNHPQVVSDPEVQGQVDPEGCCNFFKSAGNESQQEEHQESEGEQ